jgi:hypothetical protein
MGRHDALGPLGRADAHRLAGRQDAALADARDALATAQALQGSKPHSFRTGLAFLSLAQLHGDRGDAPSTKDFAQRALAQLSNSVDSGHPALQIARRLCA